MATSVSLPSPGMGQTARPASASGFLDVLMAEEEAEEDTQLPRDDEHLFPTVAIACVKKIVKDPKLAAECHEAIVAALCSPFTSEIEA